MRDRGWVLQPFAWIYGAVITLRNWGYDRGFFRSYRPQQRVISVGNISVGGTGKTPTVLLLAELLGGDVAILSRGYKSEAEKQAPCQVTTEMKASRCGDEPLLMKRRLPRAEVWVGRNRTEAAKKTQKNTILLDDGLQHRQIARDLEIIVVDGKEPFGGGHLLPRGMLRESPKALARADLIIAIDGEAKGVDRYSDAPVLIGRRELQGMEQYCGRKVAAFCGLGNPSQFFEALEAADVKLVDKWALADHQAPTEKALAAFALQAKSLGAELLLCTEKDSVKLPNGDFPLAIEAVTMRLQLSESDMKAIKEGLGFPSPS